MQSAVLEESAQNCQDIFVNNFFDPPSLKLRRAGMDEKEMTESECRMTKE
jgi:hypothetical protein